MFADVFFMIVFAIWYLIEKVCGFIRPKEPDFVIDEDSKEWDQYKGGNVNA